MVVSFNLDSRFNKDARFKKVLFGDDGKLLEVELNEFQDIMNHRLANLASLVYKDRPLYTGDYAIANGRLTITNEYVIIDSEVLFIPTASINVIVGDAIYINKQDVRISMNDPIRKYGNRQSSETIPNYLYDSRIGEETTRRIQTTYDLAKTNAVGAGSFVKLCDITSGAGGVPVVTKLTFDDSILFAELRKMANNEINKKVSSGELETVKGSTEKATKAQENSQAYTDEQIQRVSASGIPKLVSYQYILKATADNQTDFEIPLSTYDKVTDTLIINQKRTGLEYDNFNSAESSYEVTKNTSGKNIIRLKSGVDAGTTIHIVIFKNVPIGQDGAINGVVIARRSLPLDRLAEDVATKAEFDAHVEEFENTVATDRNKRVEVSPGIQAVNSPYNTLAKPISFRGKTTVNYAPLFDSGLLKKTGGNGTFTVKAPNVLELKGDGTTPSLKVDMEIYLPANTYTMSIKNIVPVSTQILNTTKDSIIATLDGTRKVVTFTITSAGTYYIRFDVLTRTDALTVEDLMLNVGAVAQQFVANVKGAFNPTIRVEGDNMLPPLTEWTVYNPYNMFAIEFLSEYSARITKPTSKNNGCLYTKLPLKPGDICTLSAELTNNTYIDILQDDNANPAYGTSIGLISSANPTITFTVPAGATKGISVVFNSSVMAEEGDNLVVNAVMLNRGTTKLPFIPKKDKEVTVLGTFYDTDNLYPDGTIVRGTEEIILGDNVKWSAVDALYSTYTRISTSDLPSITADSNLIGVKFNGSILINETYKRDGLGYNPTTQKFEMGIPFEDAGWAYGYKPTPEEIGAYFRGWRMFEDVPGTPPYSGTGVKKWMALPIDGSFTSTDTMPMYPSPKEKWQPNRIFLERKQPITEQADFSGSIALKNGDNYIEVSAGRIVRERIKAVLSQDGTVYETNHTGFPGYEGSKFSHRLGKLIQFFKNSEPINDWKEVVSNDGYSYGTQRFLIDKELFDPTAVYEVDYIPLEMFKVSGDTNPITIEFQENLGTVVGSLVDHVYENEAKTNDLKNFIANNVPKFDKDGNIVGKDGKSATGAQTGVFVDSTTVIQPYQLYTKRIPLNVNAKRGTLTAVRYTNHMSATFTTNRKESIGLNINESSSASYVGWDNKENGGILGRASTYFGSSIALMGVWIDEVSNELVLEFKNISATPATMGLFTQPPTSSQAYTGLAWEVS